MNELVSSFLRHSLTTIGGTLLARGVITSTIFDKVIGGGIILVGLIWSFSSKLIQAQKSVIDTATAVVPPISAISTSSATSTVDVNSQPVKEAWIKVTPTKRKSKSA